MQIVEGFHFNSDVETLRKGQSSYKIGEDLEFVLVYFPNHTRALNSLVRLGKREKTDRPVGSKDTIDCWFDRAIAFRPDDGAVRLLYGLWLVYRGQRTAALRELEVAREAAPEQNGNYIYNLGLAYLEVGEYEQALAAAHRAYALGYSLPGLRDRLQKLGKWRSAEDASLGSRQEGAPATGGTGATARAGAESPR